MEWKITYICQGRAMFAVGRQLKKIFYLFLLTNLNSNLHTNQSVSFTQWIVFWKPTEMSFIENAKLGPGRNLFIKSGGLIMGSFILAGLVPWHLKPRRGSIPYCLQSHGDKQKKHNSGIGRWFARPSSTRTFRNALRIEQILSGSCTPSNHHKRRTWACYVVIWF